MRKLTKYAQEDKEVESYLNTIIDRTSSASQYSKAFYSLGQKLSVPINKRINDNDKVVIACSTEDADWLTRGILNNLKVPNTRLAVFWNLRTNPFENNKITIAPIVKTYIESTDSCDILIVCKSIIYTSCVVRTNLTYLIQSLNPKQIIIAAPVMYKQAEKRLSSEFDSSINSKFEFIYFAKDDKVTSNGEVVPGIGGNIYERLGLGDYSQKNKYIPDLVKERRI